MSRILLSTYGINIENSKKDKQLLQRFNDSDDFLDFLDKFFKHIFENISNYKSLSGDSKLHLTLSEPHVRDDSYRCLYGQISTGVSGEEYKMVNLETQEVEMDVNENHGAFKDLFFYFHIPTNKKLGYLVLQRKSNYGAKTILTRAIRSHLKKEGYMQSNYRIVNFLHDKVYQKMMEFGNLKQVDLIKRKIPNDLERYVANNEQPDELAGKFITTFQSKTTLPEKWKEYLNKLFKRPTTKDRYEIEDLDTGYAEIDFKLELNGKTKTFHIVHRNRIQPDVDVSSNVDIVNGKATLESLIEQSRELITDLLDVKVQ